jgi:hypothetical protein
MFFKLLVLKLNAKTHLQNHIIFHNSLIIESTTVKEQNLLDTSAVKKTVLWPIYMQVQFHIRPALLQTKQ